MPCNALVKETGYTFGGVDAPKSDHDTYSFRYSQFVVPLVKAVQELLASGETLKVEMRAHRANTTEQARRKIVPMCRQK